MAPPAICLRDDVMMDYGETENGVPVLVYGRHRVEALRRLGLRGTEFVFIQPGDVDAELAEISENLHRAELTVLQRDEQIARWIELTNPFRWPNPRDPERSVSRQVDAKSVGRPEGGTRAASRELGISEPDARRALKVASLSPEAKTAAVEAGLDNNRTALLDAAKEPSPERQVAALEKRERAAKEVSADSYGGGEQKTRRRRSGRRPQQRACGNSGRAPSARSI